MCMLFSKKSSQTAGLKFVRTAATVQTKGQFLLEFRFKPQPRKDIQRQVRAE